jgi:signal transduction histidine kinase
MFTHASLLEVAAPSLIEASVACLCVILVRYREALVIHSTRLEEEHRSLVNLLAANESFIQRLPEIKEESAENERLRITRELHDSLGYSMTSISMIMKAAQYLIPANPEKVREYCLKANELALETMNETRATLYKLRAIGRATPRQPDAFLCICAATSRKQPGLKPNVTRGI